MTDQVEKYNKECDRLRKRLKTLNRSLYSIDEYLSQDDKDPLVKIQQQQNYFKREVEIREKKLDALKEEYEGKILGYKKELEAFKMDIERKIEKYQQKIDALSEDHYLQHLISEVSRKGEQLIAGRGKTRKQIEVEAEIKECERLLKFNENARQEAQNDLIYVMNAMKPSPKVATEVSGEQVRQQQERYYLDLDRQIQENQRRMAEEEQKKEEPIVEPEPPKNTIITSTVTVVYEGDTVNIDEFTKQVEAMHYQHLLLREQEKQAQEERKNQQRERLQAKRKELLQKASCATSAKEKNDLEFEARHLRLVDF